MASWERFLGAMSWLHFQGASASISRMNRHYFSHDRATIGVRIAFISSQRRFPHVRPPIAARSHRDRGSIGPRSWSSSMLCLRRRIEIQVIVIRTITVLRAIRCRPHDGDQTHQETPRASRGRERSRPSDDDRMIA